MSGSDSAVEQSDLRIAGTKPDRLLLRRDQLVHRSGHEFAPAEMRVCVRPVAVECDYRFVFGNGLTISLLRAQHLGFGKMRNRASCKANRSPASPVNRSAQRCTSVSASISWAVTRS